MGKHVWKGFPVPFAANRLKGELVISAVGDAGAAILSNLLTKSSWLAVCVYIDVAATRD